MPVSIQNLIASYNNLPNNTDDQYTATEVNPPNNSLDHDFQVGEDNNLVISGFQDNGGEEYNLISFIDTIKIRRVDNDKVSGDRQILWFEQQERTSSEVHLKPSLITTMEEALLGDVINRGTDNIFTNTGNKDGNDNNIERIDFISNSGLSVTPDIVSDVGFLLLERNGNDPVKVAAITALDAEGNPSEFGTLVSLNSSDWNQSQFIVNAEVMRQDAGEENLRSTADRSNDPQAISSIFLSYSDLGIVGEKVFYGFALFPYDVNEADNDLVDWQSFSTNTPESLGGLDLVSVGSIFARASVAVPPTIISEDAAEIANLTIAENNLEVTDVESTDDNDSEGNGLTYNITGGDDSNQLTIDPNTGFLTFVESPDFENPTDGNSDGIYQVEVTVTDSQGLSDVQTLNITVSDEDENTPPVIDSNDSVETAEINIVENNPVVIDFEASDDNDSEGNGLTYNITGGDDSNQLTIDPNTGFLTFVESPDFENPTDGNSDGIYQVEVTVTDSQGLSDVQTLNITVSDTVENTPPVIDSNDSVETAEINIVENNPVVIDFEASDDNDSEGNGLTYNITGGDDSNQLTIDPNTGFLTFVESPDFENPTDGNSDGIYQVEVTVTDSQGLSDVQTLNITVSDEDENTPPQAFSDNTTTPENSPVTIDVLNNDSDPDGDPLNITAIASPNDGTAEITDEGQIRFQPDPDFVGISTFDYTVTDGITTRTATVSINVTAVNQPPVAIADQATTLENSSVTLNVAANDFDPDSRLNLSGIITTDPANGSVQTLESGEIIYTPNPNFDGSDRFTYQIADEEGLFSTPASVDLTVIGINQPPVADNTTIAVEPNTTISFDDLSNRDPDGEVVNLTITNLRDQNAGQLLLDREPVEAGQIIPVEDIPQLEFEATDNFDQTSFTYNLTDNEGATSATPATVSLVKLEIPPEPNQTPTASSQDVTTAFNTPVTFDLTNSVIDTDGTVDFTTLDLDPNSPEIQTTVILENQGGFTVDDEGNITFTPVDGFEGVVSLPYTIQDNTGATSNLAEISITVNPEPPQPQTPEVEVPENSDNSEQDNSPSTPEVEVPENSDNIEQDNEAEVPENSDNSDSDNSPSTPEVEVPENSDNIEQDNEAEVPENFDNSEQDNSPSTPVVEIPDNSDNTEQDNEAEVPENFDNSEQDNSPSTPEVEIPDNSDNTEQDNEAEVPENSDNSDSDNSPSTPEVEIPDNSDNTEQDNEAEVPENSDNSDSDNSPSTPEVEIPDNSDNTEQDSDNSPPRDETSVPAEDEPEITSIPRNDEPEEDSENCCCPSLPEFIATVLPSRPSIASVPPNSPTTILGSENPDNIVGEAENEVILAFGGNDVLNSLERPDWIEGGSGHDQIRGDLDSDTLKGNSGDDTLLGGRDDLSSIRDLDGQDWVSGGEGDDFLSGNEHNDILMGDEGDDVAYGGKNDDQIFGDEGDDTLYGDRGNDTIVGTNGDENPVGDVGEQDVLFGYREQDLIQGGPGQDTIYSGKDDDFSYGGKDKDWMWGDLGDDTLYGDHGNDTIFGDTNDPNQTLAEGQDVILGGVGDDFLDGNRNNDTLIGGEGNDTVRGGKDDDLLFGDVGDDQLFGDLGNDTLCGNEGDDTLYGDTENEQAEGGQDKLCGGGGNDLLLGNQEQDTLCGGEGNDTLYGGKDNDVLKGQAGEDWLWGDIGDDTLTGGEGRDRFVLFPNTGEDTVTDFEVGEDVIVLSENVTFDALEITQQEGFTIISLSDQLDQPFAILNDVVAADLTENSFITSGI